MNTPPPLIQVARTGFGTMLDVLIAKTQGCEFYAAELSWRPVPEDEYLRPTCHINPGDAQALMDQLWTCGLRPSEGSGSAGALAATQRHLDDFRKLVFEDSRFKP